MKQQNEETNRTAADTLSDTISSTVPEDNVIPYPGSERQDAAALDVDERITAKAVYSKAKAGIKNKRSRMFLIYLLRLIGRGLILLGALYAYFFHPGLLASFVGNDFFKTFDLRHILWIVLVTGMVLHLLPKVRITMSGLKSRSYTYHEPEEGYDVSALFSYTRYMNIRAWIVMLVWLLFNGIFAALYLLNIIGKEELVLLMLFYFTSDLICMLIFCPFQSFIMKNRCCVNCRIFDWGHFMMYTPMILIPSFFSWSLFFLACVVLVRWEMVYAARPQRFWRGSNLTIRCENCKDRTCQIKKPLREVYTNIFKEYLQ